MLSKKTTSIIKPQTTPLIKIFYPNHITNLESIKWGKLDGAVALKEFLIIKATKHRNFKVNKCWLFLDQQEAPSKDLTVKLIKPNDTHYQNVEISLSTSFRSYTYPILLGYKELSFCAKCEKISIQTKRNWKERMKLIITASSVISVCAGTIIVSGPAV